MSNPDQPASGTSQPNGIECEKKYKFPKWLCISLVILAAIAVLTIGFAVLVFIAFWFLKTAFERTQFLAQAISSVLVLVVITAQAIIYNQQRRLLKKQLENAQFSERAYIGVQAANIIDLEVGKVPFVRVEFLNGGRTAAFDTHTVIELLIGEDEPRVFDKGGGVIPAGLPLKMNYSFPNKADAFLVSDIEEGTIRVRFRGRVRFIDCWGNDQGDPVDYIWIPNSGVFQAYKTFLQEQAEAQEKKS